MSASQSQTFHASVSQDAISKVTRLFNASLDDIFSELFQNSRRSGATSISITMIDHFELGRAIHFSDNGPGLDDPKSLFTLGTSDWSDETKSSEDAAGMGFFSLANRSIKLIVQQKGTSQSWQLSADPACFKGEQSIVCSPSPSGHRGMSIFIQSKEYENWKSAAERAALYCPIHVLIDGQLAPSEDFLKSANHISVWNGIRIGVYTDKHRYSSFSGANINFHGVTLHAHLPQLSQLFHAGFHAKLDVVDCANVKLVLPARKEVVEDDFFGQLKTQIFLTYFQLIADKGAHSLSFKDYSKALSHGFTLPEAQMKLRPFSPAVADRDQYYDQPYEPLPQNAILFDECGDAIPDQNLSMAISKSDKTFKLYEPYHGFKGYHWYDDLSVFVISGYHLQYQDCEDIVEPGEQNKGSNRPQSMRILGEIGTSDDLIPWQCETDILVLGNEDENFLHEVSLCITKTVSITRDYILDLLARSLFCPSDDLEAGSYEEQEKYFSDQAEDLVITMLESDNEANKNAVIRTIARELYWLRKDDIDVTIHIAKGDISVTGMPV